MTRQSRRWTAQEALGAAIGSDPMPSIVVACRKLSLEAERTRLADGLLYQLERVGLGGLFTKEHRFHPERRWRLDLYCDSERLGIELHGGIYSGGRHTRGQGFEADREKMNAALEAGIRVLEYTPKEVKDGSALAQIERIINQEK